MLFRLGSAHVDINPWNPLYAVAPFILLLVSIPLVTFAIATTCIAITVLACRGLVVYLNLGAALLIAWLSPQPRSHYTHRRLSTPSPETLSPQRHRIRTSTSSNNSSQDTAVATALAPNSGSFTALSRHNDARQDYEGVGGWRNTGDDDEEALWMSINGRLELPAGPPIRRHQRSLTGGALPVSRRSGSPEALRTSPFQSRTMTPMRQVADERGYFPPQPIPRIHSMSNVSDPLQRHQRRVSGSTSSTSSGLMLAVKEVGE